MMDMNRKVNKPRTTLRKSQRRELEPKYRGVVPAIIELMSKYEEFPPETLLMLFGMMVSNPDAWSSMKKKNLPAFRRYLKKHNITDWSKK